MKTLEADYARVNLPEVTVRKIDDLSEEECEMVKVFGKKDKNAQNEKQSLTGLSEEEIEKALEASTFGGGKKHVNVVELDEDDIIMKGMEEEIEKLKQANADLRRINEEWAGGKKEDLEVLKAECIELNEEKKQLERHVELADAEIEKLKMEKKKLQRELDDMKKTISKMKYAHEEEVRALEDDLAESKILNKKAGEYSSMLDADSDAFETILELAKIIHGLAKNAESISLLIKDEVEGHI